MTPNEVVVEHLKMAIKDIEEGRFKVTNVDMKAPVEFADIRDGNIQYECTGELIYEITIKKEG